MLNIKKRSISALVNTSRKYYAQKLRNTRENEKDLHEKHIGPNNTIIVSRETCDNIELFCI